MFAKVKSKNIPRLLNKSDFRTGIISSSIYIPFDVDRKSKTAKIQGIDSHSLSHAR